MDVPIRGSKGVQRPTRQDSARSGVMLYGNGSDVQRRAARRRLRTFCSPSAPVQSASVGNPTHAFPGDRLRRSEWSVSARALRTSMRRRGSGNGRENAGQGSGHEGMLEPVPYRSRTASRQLKEIQVPGAHFDVHHTFRTGRIRSDHSATWIASVARSLLCCHMLISTRRRSHCHRRVDRI
jgi:hypothetical protein